jgi:hypothetical protein
MNTRRISVNEPGHGNETGNGGFANTKLYSGIRRQSNSRRELVLWLLLAVFLLAIFADAAYAADRRGSAHARSPDAGVPTYNIEAICRGAESISRILETTAPDNAQNCRDDERHAREQLLEQWTQFDAADRGMCDGAAQSGAVEPTYTELMTCLEMTRDNLNRQANAHVAQRSDRLQPSTPVGTAPAQGTKPVRHALAGR